MKRNPLIKRLQENLQRAGKTCDKMKFGMSGGVRLVVYGLELCLIFPDKETVRAYRLYRSQRVPPDAVRIEFKHQGNLEKIGAELWSSGLINETAAVLIFGVDRGPGKIVPIGANEYKAAA